jgi:antitoxin ParD1/3/4
MVEQLNLELTDELRAFIDENCGDGTLYSSPSEFVRDLIRQRKRQIETENIRHAIIDGYQDAIAGRTLEFQGDLRNLIQQVDL